jgi:hypothetical protein
VKNIPIRAIFAHVVATLTLVISGCSKVTPLQAEFKDLTSAVHAYCNMPALQRSPEVRIDLRGRLNAFEAELTSVPAETRLRFRDRIANQRCFLEMAR